MKHFIPLLLLLATTACSQAERKPNVVLFLIDDLGWADLGITGSEYYETPRIDQLAAEGAFFSHGYAANPVCSPTRASILTGQYPSRIHMTNHSGSEGPKGKGHKLTPPKVAGHIPLEQTTLAEALKAHGYQTAHIGKWHLTAHHYKGKDYFPEANGFDINIAGHRMGQPGDYYYPYKSEQHPSTNVPDMEDGNPGDYLTDALTDKAIDFVKNASREQPFFLNFWYYTVHTPIIPDRSKLEKYEQKARELGYHKDKDPGRVEHQSLSRTRQDNARYATMVESMDVNIGRLLDTLKAEGLEEDTIVIFLSDNGGLSTGVGLGAPTSCDPLRAGKAWVYEGGIRSPIIVKYPKKVKPGIASEQPAVSTDLFPTILDLAGLPLLPDQHLDGVALTPILTGAEDKLDRKSIYIHYPHYHHINTQGPAGAIREGHWKLIEPYETGEIELYNVVADPGETDNLADKQPEMAKNMQARLHAWLEESGSRRAEPNADYVAEEDWRIGKGK